MPRLQSYNFIFQIKDNNKLEQGCRLHSFACTEATEGFDVRQGVTPLVMHSV